MELRRRFWEIFNDRASVALGLFFLALGARLAFLFLNPHLNYGFVSVLGLPFSDAMEWNDLANHLIRGDGIVGPWAAQRPLYPVFLASFYTWFGESFVLAKILNALVVALSVALVFRIGDWVFGRTIGFLAAALPMIDWDQACQSMTLMSEPLGLGLFVSSVYLLIRGVKKESPRDLFFSGLLFAFCNLARPLTLLAFPVYLACLFREYRRRGFDHRRTLRRVGLFALGAALGLAPWLIRQKKVIGIWAITSKTAESFYAATTPRFGQWSSSSDFESTVKGGEPPRDKYLFQMAKARENLLSNPSFYLGNVIRSFGRYIAQVPTPFPRANGVVVAAFFLFVWRFLSPRVKASPIRWWLWLAPAVGVFLLPNKYYFLFSVLGLLGAGRRGGTVAWILIGSLLFAGLGNALVGGSIMDRTFTMGQWLFLLFFFEGIRLAVEAYGRRVVFRKPIDELLIVDRIQIGGAEAAGLLARLARKTIGGAVAVGVGFFLISGFKLFYLNAIRGPLPTTEPAPLTFEEKKAWVEQMSAALGKPLMGRALESKSRFFDPTLGFVREGENHGRWVVGLGRLTSYRYFLAANTSIPHWSRLFDRRDFDRVICRIDPLGWVVVPGKISDLPTTKDMIVIGLANVDIRRLYQGRTVIEAMALRPFKEESRLPPSRGS